MQKIRKNDEVVVIAGKDKGAKGVVLRHLGDSLVVAGVNVKKKHQKPNPAAGVEGGIVSFEKPVDVSNVMLVDPASGQAGRVGFKVLESGKKVRVLKLKTGHIVLDAKE